LAVLLGVDAVLDQPPVGRPLGAVPLEVLHLGVGEVEFVPDEAGVGELGFEAAVPSGPAPEEHARAGLDDGRRGGARKPRAVRRVVDAELSCGDVQGAFSEVSREDGAGDGPGEDGASLEVQKFERRERVHEHNHAVLERNGKKQSKRVAKTRAEKKSRQAKKKQINKQTNHGKKGPAKGIRGKAGESRREVRDMP